MSAHTEWRPGTEVARLIGGPASRDQLRAYAEASRDFHPLHLDPEAAKRAGYADVFAHGMLVAAWLGRCLTEAVEQTAVREWRVRFVGVTRLGDVVLCIARVDEMSPDGRTAVLRLTAEVEGEAKAVGTAIVEAPAWARGRSWVS